jgi:hypothetical protein
MEIVLKFIAEGIVKEWLQMGPREERLEIKFVFWKNKMVGLDYMEEVMLWSDWELG